MATREGWLYLAAVLDLGSRRIVGWAMGDTLEATVAVDALQAALQAHRPPPGLIHHSDRGVQYASYAYQILLEAHGCRPSMSLRGNCWDNAPMESFFHTLKTELLTEPVYPTRAAARQAIFAYIEIWYNRQRLHSALGYRFSDDYERVAA